ncbi:60S acidic ribosomal protein family [Prunus dulcis]|uniref:60S acidic ribosomal protein family n=1 Tax=Prunus dulcis TaxID=3755 RepID=A0A4Y1RMI8_PRUDU|nr:60S acidic ribosomal protein family [Prunus dulcis]
MEMKVVAAYLLAVLGGKTSPSAADLKDILGSAPVLEHLNPTFMEELESCALAPLNIVQYSVPLLALVNFILGWHFGIGAEADGDRIELLLSEVKGKDITELIASGREKLASVPSGGASAADAGAAAPAALSRRRKRRSKRRKTQMMIWDSAFSTKRLSSGSLPIRLPFASRRLSLPPLRKRSFYG